LVQCTDAAAPIWRYYYGADVHRKLRSETDGMCLKRDHGDPQFLKADQCEPDEIFQIWWLGGADHGVFEYHDSFADNNTGVDYCIGTEESKACLHSGDQCAHPQVRATSFRDYDAPSQKHLGLRPLAAVQEVTSDSLVFQAWLWSDFGRPARALLASVDALGPGFRRFDAAIRGVHSGVQAVSRTISNQLDPLFDAESRLSGWSSSLSNIRRVLKIFERIPYIGKACRAPPLPLQTLPKQTARPLISHASADRW